MKYLELPLVGAVPTKNEIVFVELPIIFLQVILPVKPFDCTPSILPACSFGVQFLETSTNKFVDNENVATALLVAVILISTIVADCIPIILYDVFHAASVAPLKLTASPIIKSWLIAVVITPIVPTPVISIVQPDPAPPVVTLPVPIEYPDPAVYNDTLNTAPTLLTLSTITLPNAPPVVIVNKSPTT